MFHTIDTTRARLDSCLKRAKSMAKEGVIPTDHPLSAAFYNMMLYLDASEGQTSDDIVADLLALDWFALKVDEYSKTHMLTTDPVVCAMLYQWRQRMPYG